MRQKDLIAIFVGKRFLAYRKKLGFTQEYMADIFKLARPSIVNIEKGKQSVTIYTLLMACAVFKCKPADLLPPIPKVELKEIVWVTRTKTLTRKTMDANFKW